MLRFIKPGIILGISFIGSFTQSQPVLVEQISAHLQAGIDFSVQAVEAMNQDTTYYNMEETFNYVYDVQQKASSSAMNFEFVLQNIVQLANGLSQDSPDYYALSQLYDLSQAGYDAFEAIHQWMAGISNALLMQDETRLDELSSDSSQIESLLIAYAYQLDGFVQAYDATTPDRPEAGMSALEYLENQPATSYETSDTYDLMSDVASWGHQLNMSIIDNFPAGGNSYYCRVGIDAGCY